MSKSKKPEMLKTIDWWAIWIGFVIILVGLFIFIPPKNTNTNHDFHKLKEEFDGHHINNQYISIRAIIARDSLEKLISEKNNFVRDLTNMIRPPFTWTSNPVEAFYLSKEGAAEKSDRAIQLLPQQRKKVANELNSALIEEEIAISESFKNSESLMWLTLAVSHWRKEAILLQNLEFTAIGQPYKHLPNLILFFIFMAVFFGTAEQFMDKKFGKFAGGFTFIFAVSLLAFTLSANKYMMDLGLGYPFWALLLGIICNKLFGAPKWLSQGAKMELFIKTGIVLLGAEVVLGQFIFKMSFTLWLIIALVIVLIFIVYFLSVRLFKLKSQELGIQIALAAVLGGLPGLLAAAPACKARKYEFTVIAALSVLFSIILNLTYIPYLTVTHFPAYIGFIGQWFHGTGMGLSEFENWNIIGGYYQIFPLSFELPLFLMLIAALTVSIVWRFKEEPPDISDLNMLPADIWKKFPKYIIGAMASSAIVTVIYHTNPEDISYLYLSKGFISEYIQPIRNWIFCFAFTAAGMTFNFAKARETLIGLKPVFAYLIGIILSVIVFSFVFWII